MIKKNTLCDSNFQWVRGIGVSCQIAFNCAPVSLSIVTQRRCATKDAFGLPKPIEARVVDGVERYFLRHVFFRDDLEELLSGGGRGIVSPRFA